ncbi:MAG: PKD domain-containing protein [Bacteroidota bacterium]|nr:PKD domain-containing protein [Bacteroidota bacterium]
MLKNKLPLFFLVFFFMYFNSAFAIKRPIQNSTFIENKGQIIDQFGKNRNDIKYLLSSNSFSVHLKTNSFSYEFQKKINNGSSNDIKKTSYEYHRIDIELLNCNVQPEIIPVGKNKEYFNYYNVESKPNGITHVNTYKKIIYKNIYPNIDLMFYSKHENDNYIFKYDFIIHHGGDINLIKVKYNGMDNISLDDSSNLEIKTRFGIIQEQIPICYTESNETINIKFSLSKNIVSYKSKKNIYLQTLYIDPIVKRVWGTYFGGSRNDVTSGLAVDSNSNAIICGTTISSSNIATSGSHQDTFGGFRDAFVAKFDSTGTLLWATYIGGIYEDRAYDITTDYDDDIYMTGWSLSSTNIASNGAYQSSLAGGRDAFIIKLYSNGTRAWGTYLGGNSFDEGAGIMSDLSKNIFVVGWTESTSNLATSGAYQTTYGGGSKDAFISKSDSSGNLIWCTYYGGNDYERARKTCIDDSNNLFIVGQTGSSSSITTSGSHQPIYGGGSNDAFILKFSTNGNRLWGTYYGGISDDKGYQITLLGNYFYIVGFTSSSNNIATSGTHQPSLSGGFDGFIAKFDLLGNRSWGTYYGGTNDDLARAIIINQNASIIISGQTKSTSNIATNGSHQTTIGSYYDGFLAKFNNNGTQIWGTYYGGNGDDYFARKMALDPEFYIYTTGVTESTSNIATSGTHQTTYGGGTDAMVIRFCDQPIIIRNPGDRSKCENDSVEFHVTLDGSGAKYYWYKNGNLISGENDSVLSIMNLQISDSGNYFCIIRSQCLNGSDTSFIAHLSVYPTPNINLGNDTTIYSSQYLLNASYSGASYLWQDNSTDSTFLVTQSGTYWVKASIQNCHTFDTINISMLIPQFTPYPCQDYVWAIPAFSNGDEIARRLIMDTLGNSYITGYCDGSTLKLGKYSLTSKGQDDAFIAKINKKGIVIWAKRFGGSTNDLGKALAFDTLGNIYFFGSFYSNSISFGSTTLSNNGSEDLFLVKLDTHGSIIWAKSFGGSLEEDAYGVSVDQFNNVYIAGRFISSTITFGTQTVTKSGLGDLFFVKLNSSGNTIWVNHIGTNDDDRAIYVLHDNNGDIYISGRFESTSLTFGSTTLTNYGPQGTTDFYLAKYNNSGQFAWVVQAGGNDNDGLFGADIDQYGNIYVTGQYSSSTMTFKSTNSATASISNNGGRDVFMAKYDSTGKISWAKSIGGSLDERGTSISVNDIGSLYLTGYFKSNSVSFDSETLTNKGGSDAFITKYDYSGNVIWAKNIAGTGDEEGRSIKSDNKGNLTLTGWYSSQLLEFNDSISLNNYINNDVFIARIEPVVITSFTQTNLDCESDSSASIDLTIDCGVPPFSYHWSTGDTTEDLSNLPAGKYSVTVTDSMGLKGYEQITINYIEKPLDIGESKLLFSLNDDLIAYYPFDGNTNDQSGNNHNATNHGATLTNGICGQAYSFDGNNDYIETSYHPDFTPEKQSWTLSAWVKVPSSSVGSKKIIEWYRCGVTNCTNQDYAGYQIRFDPSNKIDFRLRNNTTTTVEKITSSISYADNKWHLVTGIYDQEADSIWLYVDKCLVGSKKIADLTISDGGNQIPLEIGRQYSTTNSKSYFEGLIDEARIYNKALKPYEVRSLYHKCKPLGIDVIHALGCSVDSSKITLFNPEYNVSYQLVYETDSSQVSTSKRGLCLDSLLLFTGAQFDTLDIKIIATHVISGCTKILDTTIINHFSPSPIGDFSVNDSSQCFNNNYFYFTNNSSISSGNLSYFWDLGNGTNAYSKDTNYSYQDTGKYIVKLICVSDHNCSDTITKVISIYPDPDVSFNINDSSQCLDNNNFIFTTTSDTSGISFKWFFSDGITSNTLNLTRKFSKTGTYQAKLIATSNFACKDSLTKTFIISDAPPPDFSINDTSQCLYGNDFIFANNTDTSSGNLSFIWRYDDGTNAYSKDGKHSYGSIGGYFVELVVIDKNGCRDSITKAIKVHQGSIADFDTIIDKCSMSVQLVNKSIDASTYYWSFGDGNSSEEENPLHQYSEGGEYEIFLFTDKNIRCSDTTSVLIKVKNINNNIFIPNVFTPNNDGLNDKFKMSSIEYECFPYTLMIFNRWGQKIYDSKDSIGIPIWDGTYKGKLISEGVYYYILIGNNFKRSGTVTLIR